MLDIGIRRGVTIRPLPITRTTGPFTSGSNPRPFDQVVADVQSVLQEQGYYHGEVDGLVGPLTREALASYQSAQGLEPTAAIDQPTLESLGLG